MMRYCEPNCILTRPHALGMCKVKDNVIQGTFEKPILEVLCLEIKEAIHQYDNRISLAEAIGILEIVKSELLISAIENS